VKDWSKYTSGETALYTESGQALFEQIDSLVANTTKATETITQSSKTVNDNSKDFDSLVESANKTQADAQKVLDNTQELVTASTDDLGLSKGYQENFSKVLANTRTPGVDAGRLYNFFVEPIKAKDISSKETKAKTKHLDFRWIVVFGMGLIFGMLLMLVGKFIFNR